MSWLVFGALSLSKGDLHPQGPQQPTYSDLHIKGLGPKRSRNSSKPTIQPVSGIYEFKKKKCLHSQSLGQPLLKKQKITSVRKDVEKLEPCLVLCWCKYKMAQLVWKMVWRFLKNLDTALPYDPAIPLLGIRPKELKAGNETLVHPCSQQDYSPQPKGGSNPSAHQRLDGSTPCGVCIQWNIIQP